MKNIVLACILLCSGNFYAQTIRGKVLNAQQKPIEGVAVLNQRSGEHSHTDHTGTFRLNNTLLNDRISFTSLGYESQEITLTNSHFDERFSIVLVDHTIALDQVVLRSQRNALSQLADVDLKITPVKSSQEILRKVPGLIIGQHAGGGKAEQLFLRGFDVDHGTDVALSVDGMPVNMVSHAHGQGYADLHFVIPETIENINFGKGPYFYDQGNFNTAGFVDLHLRKRLDQNLISFEMGQFNTQRFVGMFKIASSERSQTYLASELSLTDGPFDASQNFNRLNIMAKYTGQIQSNQELSLSLSHFQSRWDASGQIPQRLVDNGTIGRFGAVDDTEGGETSRTNIQVSHKTYIDDKAVFKTNAYLTQYAFDLYSNFTFFLEDPVNGDQIHQYEKRTLAGIESKYSNMAVAINPSLSFSYDAGVGYRFDQTNDSELSSTLNRKTTLTSISLGDISESNLFGYLNGSFSTEKWTFNPSVRADYFNFAYINQIPETYDSQGTNKFTLSPKFNITYTPSHHWQLFLKSGIGFHSNDTRVILANQTQDILPKAYGVDLGTIIRPSQNLIVNAALWGLQSEQEFVYVGDAGIVEPSGESRRLGVEFGARYQPLPWLYVYGDINYTYARSTEEPEGEDYIPLAPKLTSAGGISFDKIGNFYGGWSYRYIGDRPALEDNSLIAKGYFVSDFNINYQWRKWSAGIIIENLFDTAWNETQFATTSQLSSEPNPVEEIHFTPGTPFAIRAKLSIRF